MFPNVARLALWTLSLPACLACVACAPAPQTPRPTLTSAEAHATQRPSAPRSFSVKVTGRGRPVILIPGLACSGEVWDDFVRHYAAHYEMHVLTLPGFAGQPAVPGATLASIRSELASYIRETGLQAPVVIGHSLGGTLAFALAEREPALVGEVVAVDGVPYLPALMNPQATPETMAAPAHRIASSIAQAPAEAFRAQNRASAATMVSDPVQVDRIAAWGAASDARTVGAAMEELMTTDLRIDEGSIRAPVLLFASAKDAATPEARAATAAAYEAQVAQIPDHRVLLAERARHFVMLDDPEFLYASIDAFLASRMSRAGAGQ
jgi:N-formylmaleamate deformylase